VTQIYVRNIFFLPFFSGFTQFAATLAELHAENQRLRDEVDQVNDKYHALQNQVMKMMEKQRKNEVI